LASKLLKASSPTFKILFSLAVEETQGQRKDSPVITRGKGQRVLVVDDEPEIRNAMEGLLEYLKYRTEFASSGIEGLEKYRSIQPDAVLMDINMPDMDGVSSIEEIFKYDPAANISIFSGYNQDTVDNLSPKAKAAIKDFIPKPIGLEALSALLAKMLKK